MDIVSKARAKILENPIENLKIIAVVCVGIISFVLFVAQAMFVWPTLIGGLLVIGLAYHIWSLRSLAEEIDVFSKENARLDETEERLGEELDTLQGSKKKLTNQCDQLEGTVSELTTVSENLQNELKGFEKLKSNLEKFAGETGADVKKILDEASKLESKMQKMTNDNERSLLGKIAQDLEFMDRDVGMSKYEFEKFMERLPGHCQIRFKDLGLTFDSVAGEDGIIDFMEVEKMIDHLVKENNDKATIITVKS